MPIDPERKSRIKSLIKENNSDSKNRFSLANPFPVHWLSHITGKRRALFNGREKKITREGDFITLVSP